jgi:hypothetical protein
MARVMAIAVIDDDKTNNILDRTGKWRRKVEPQQDAADEYVMRIRGLLGTLYNAYPYI